MLHFDGCVDALFLEEADEAEALRVLFAVDLDFGAEDVAGLGEDEAEVLAADFLGEVLDDDVEFTNQLAVLDLPHESELFAVDFLVVFVLEGLLGFLVVGEVDLAEAETLSAREVPAHFDA